MNNHSQHVNNEPRGRTVSSWVFPSLVAVVSLVAAMLGSPLVRAAQLEFRSECTPLGPIVTLGDLAEVLADDPQQAELAAIELFPTPPPGGRRFLEIREIQDLLMNRGVNLLEHELSGSSRITILGRRQEPLSNNVEPLPLSVAENANRKVRDAIVKYLQQYASGTQPWDPDVRLDQTQARRIATAKGEPEVRGGKYPWLGMQQFELMVTSPEGPVSFTVSVEVSLPPAVVVTARSLAQGTMIHASDVQLQRRQPADMTSQGFHAIEDVLGKEVTRAIGAGGIVEARSVRLPLNVRRGEVIFVYARSPGIQVRTAARAREEGSLGDLISVESLSDRTEFYARVCGLREAEVYARATQAEQSAMTGGNQYETGMEASGSRKFPHTMGNHPPMPPASNSIRSIAPATAQRPGPTLPWEVSRRIQRRDPTPGRLPDPDLQTPMPRQGDTPRWTQSPQDSSNDAWRQY